MDHLDHPLILEILEQVLEAWVGDLDHDQVQVQDQGQAPDMVLKIPTCSVRERKKT